MATLQKYDLMELPWTDISDWIKAGNDVVMIPVGSVEKHGHHVPLGVDSHTTMGSVERAAKKAKVVHTPLMPFGHSPHHMGEVGWGTGSVSLGRSIPWGQTGRLLQLWTSRTAPIAPAAIISRMRVTPSMV